ncbi:hypothetical protein DV736_g2788, partial [Chaetothyriales sp. CBS 134916]
MIEENGVAGVEALKMLALNHSNVHWRGAAKPKWVWKPSHAHTGKGLMLWNRYGKEDSPPLFELPAHLNQLAWLIIEDLHGSFLAHIFKQLLHYGRLSHFQTAQFCHLPVKQVKTGLAALIQLRLVHHYTTYRGLCTYEADIDAAYDLVRIGKVTALANTRLGPLGGKIVEEIALQGSLPVSQIVARINDALPEGEKVSALKISRTLQALTTDGFLRNIRPAHLQILHDTEQDIDFELRQRLGTNSKTKGKKAQLEHAILVKTEMEKHFGYHLNPQCFDGLGESDPGPATMRQDEIHLCIDFNVVVRYLREVQVLRIVEKALSPEAARAARAVIEQIDFASPLRDHLTDSLRLPTSQILTYSRLRDSLTRTAHPPNGTGNSNGCLFDSSLSNGIDHGEDAGMDRSNFETSLSLISEGPFPFLSRDPLTSTWSVDALKLSRWLRGKEIDTLINQRVGTIGLRVKRMLVDKGKLEEKHLQELGLLVAKELRQTLAQLATWGVVELQEVPREPQRQPNRTIFLWFFDQERAKKVILGDLYKTMARLFKVLRRGREILKGTFEKIERAGNESNPEEYLIGEERIAFLHWRRKEMWLIGEIERLDDSVTLLRDCGGGVWLTGMSRIFKKCMAMSACLDKYWLSHNGHISVPDRMRTDERPVTRTLVRWNDDLDKSILLFINFACAEAGIKIPFGRVAELMGPRFSEGAIVQHIAKIRSKMQDEKEKTNPELLVPPPNKRGSVTKPASAMCYANSRHRKTSDFSDLIYESNIKSRREKVKRELEEDDYGHDPDYEWGSSETLSVKKSKKIPGKQKQDILTLRYSRVKPGGDGDSEDACSPTSTPARPRRGIKVNYASIVEGVSGNEESGNEDAIHGEAGMPGRTAQPSARKLSSSGKEFTPNVCTRPRDPSFPTTVAMDATTLDMLNAGLMPSLENGIGGVGGLPWFSHQHELNPFTDFNFNASSFSADPGIALGMPTDIPARGYGSLSHGSFEDEKLPSPKYSDFLDFDHNSVA